MKGLDGKNVGGLAKKWENWQCLGYLAKLFES